MTREEVYQKIDAEREYQEAKWHGEKHSILDYVVFIEEYLKFIKNDITFNNELGEYFARHNLRKVAALSVACMEQHGCEDRIHLVLEKHEKQKDFGDGSVEGLTPATIVKFEDIKRTENQFVDGGAKVTLSIDGQKL